MSRLLAIALLTACVAASVAALADQAREIYPQKLRSFHRADEFTTLTQGRVRIDRGIDQQHLAAIRAAGVSLPVADVTVLVPESASIVWIGTARGAVRLNRADGSRQYLAGCRTIA